MDHNLEETLHNLEQKAESLQNSVCINVILKGFQIYERVNILNASK